MKKKGEEKNVMGLKSFSFSFVLIPIFLFLSFSLFYSCSFFSWKEKREIPPSPASLISSKEVQEKKSSELLTFCHKIEKSFKRYGWGKSSCLKMGKWRYHRKSVKGTILPWQVFGQDHHGHFYGKSSGELKNSKVETTLIMCGVHGDEITPIKFCFDIMNYLLAIEEGKIKEEASESVVNLKGKLIIVAPLVNPDGYFKTRPTRTNARGVDVNRNFPTRDFKRLAFKRWVERYRRDKRRFPGRRANSEPETLFQVNLIYRYRPDKIISVHAPLTMLDYDGPASLHGGGPVGPKANELLIQMSEKAKGYRIKNYPFFPGSLGNYAGNERNIPTYTLELPSSDARKSENYWRLFKKSVHVAITKGVKGGALALEDLEKIEDKEKSPEEKKSTKAKRKNN